MPETCGVPGLCRVCLQAVAGQDANCSACGSAQVIRHKCLHTLSIAHIDCDAFYAAIEKRDRPELRDRPVIIGGGQRGVVATACYVARLYGIHSAQPMFKALKACPDAVVIRPDFARYSAVGRAIRERMLALTPLVEPVSIDEAYLDLSGTLRMHGASPAELLLRLQAEIVRDFGITVSVGLSANKFLAKTASELDKPRGFAVISPGDAAELLAPRPVSFIHGVGKQFARRLARDGYETVADLQAAPAERLMKAYGEMGQLLHARAFGRDSRPVRADRERKSVSSETTFSADIADLASLEDRLWQVCVKTSDRAKAEGVVGRAVTLKLKTTRFRTLTRRTSLTVPTQLARTLFDATRPMLARSVGDGPFRLIGVGIADLSEAKGDAVDLVDPRIAKRAAAERAADLARAKFGAQSVRTGRAARSDATPRPGKEKPGQD